jgi:hypothetical protein
MIADLELTTTETEPCASCGRRHRHRVAVAGARGDSSAELLGFFGRCPETGRRVWHVAPVRPAREPHGRVLRIGPADDDEWAPPAPDLAAATAGGRLPPAGDLPPRGPDTGGLRRRHRTPDLLRRVLGCPIW